MDPRIDLTEDQMFRHDGEDQLDIDKIIETQKEKFPENVQRMEDIRNALILFGVPVKTRYPSTYYASYKSRNYDIQKTLWSNRYFNSRGYKPLIQSKIDDVISTEIENMMFDEFYNHKDDSSGDKLEKSELDLQFANKILQDVINGYREGRNEETEFFYESTYADFKDTVISPLLGNAKEVEKKSTEAFYQLCTCSIDDALDIVKYTLKYDTDYNFTKYATKYLVSSSSYTSPNTTTTLDSMFTTTNTMYDVSVIDKLNSLGKYYFEEDEHDYGIEDLMMLVTHNKSYSHVDDEDAYYNLVKLSYYKYDGNEVDSEMLYDRIDLDMDDDLLYAIRSRDFMSRKANIPMSNFILNTINATISNTNTRDIIVNYSDWR